MGKLKQFAIMFTDDRSVFFPGNVLVGQVIVDLNSPMEMTAIKLKFVGKAHVHWSESSGSGKNRTTRHYSATEVLFENAVVLHGKGSASSSERRELSQGQHSFPFNFHLPAQLPSSFEDRVGYIRYYVKSSIVKPWKFDHDTKRAFTVLDVLDLNAIPNMLNPSGSSESKTLCCLCCASGPIQLEFHLDHTGYVPGEWVIVNATLTNTSNTNVEKTSAELVQTVKYHATSKTKTAQKSLNLIYGPGCRPHSSINWNNERIHIPPLPPSESTHCRIIDINYSIKFTVHLRTFAVNLRCEAPMVIGTIPLQSLQIYQNPGYPQPSLPQAELPAMPEPAHPPGASNMAPTSYGGTVQTSMAPTAYSTQPPPPSYAMATEGSANINDEDDSKYTMGEMTFTPQYTYYDWNESAFTYSDNSGK